MLPSKFRDIDQRQDRGWARYSDFRLQIPLAASGFRLSIRENGVCWG